MYFRRCYLAIPSEHSASKTSFDLIGFAAQKLLGQFLRNDRPRAGSKSAFDRWYRSFGQGALLVFAALGFFAGSGFSGSAWSSSGKARFPCFAASTLGAWNSGRSHLAMSIEEGASESSEK